MGVGYKFLCTDCREYATVGYGSYSTWIYANTIEEYDRIASPHRDLHKNKNLETLLRKHDGHKKFVLNMDCAYERNNKVYIENGSHYNPKPDELVADITDYKRFEPDEVQEYTKQDLSSE